MSEIVSYRSVFSHTVLAVAVKRVDGRRRDTDNSLIYAWQVLIKGVPGYSHEREAQSVKDHGTKVPEDFARMLFPGIDEVLGGKLRYAY